MMNTENTGLLKAVFYTMLRVTGFILTFFLIGGPYYHLLDSMFDMATGRGIAELTTWSQWVYWSFYYGFPSLMVFGIIASIVYLFLVVRRRYFSTEEVYY